MLVTSRKSALALRIFTLALRLIKMTLRLFTQKLKILALALRLFTPEIKLFILPDIIRSHKTWMGLV